MKIADLPRMTYSSGEIQDFAIQLRDSGIEKIIQMIYEAYLKLNDSKIITIQMDEVQITEEFFIKVQGVWREKGDQNIIPMIEKPHERPIHGRGRSSTIDFCFRDEWNSKAYFGSECKKLNDNNPRGYKEYIDNGVNRFLLGKYSAHCSKGSMIGYIVDGNPEKIVSEILKRVDDIADVSKSKNSDMIKEYHFHYISGHFRNIGVSPIHIHHLFFIFSSN